MSDEIYRKNAKQCIEDIYFYPPAEKEIAHKQAIAWYLRIQSKTMGDIKALAARYRDLAIIYFNWAHADLSNYKQAGHYYSQSIQELQQMELDDESCRELTELYIDLSDVFIYLSDTAGADGAMENAMKAFKLIKIKNSAESDIGDPVKNFLEFRRYFECKTSTSNYLVSIKFKNHEQILLARKKEQEMASMLDGINLVEKPAQIGPIDAMMDRLKLSNAAMASFTPMNLDKPSNDMDYRGIAIEYLRLIQQHAKQDNLLNTIATYKQANKALKEIKHKNDDDLASILEIEKQIILLDTPDETSRALSEQETSGAPSLWHKNTQVVDSLISKIRMFGSVTTPAASATQEPYDASSLQPME